MRPRWAVVQLTANLKGVLVNLTKLARISALTLVLFLTSIAAFAQQCGCTYCQRFPDRDCTIEGTRTTCLEFLAVALCPPVGQASVTEPPSSEEAFLASLSGTAQQAPAGCVSLSN